MITAFDKIEGEIEPDINNEAVEATILHMTHKHNKNTAQYSLKNRNDYFEYKDNERFKTSEKDNRKCNKLLNEQNPEKEKEEGNNDLIFLPELLAALQEAIKVIIASLYSFIFLFLTPFFIFSLPHTLTQPHLLSPTQSYSLTHSLTTHHFLLLTSYWRCGKLMSAAGA